MLDLQKGGNAPAPSGALSIAVRWSDGQAVGDIDVSAFLLRANGEVSGDSDMVFYGQPQSAGGALRIERLASPAGGRIETAFVATFAQLPADVERIAFAATIHEGAAKGLSFARVKGLEVVIAAGGDAALRFIVPTDGAVETALILGEFYRRAGVWKFRAVGQGFVGGLTPLARSFGVDVADHAPQPQQPPPALVQPAVPPVSLAKVTLDKARPSINLAKSADGFGEIKINLNWNRGKIGGGLFGGARKGVDLDLGCLFEMQDGSKGAVQALGDTFGAFDTPPYIVLSVDDRTGASADGEWIRVNGRFWSKIRRVLVYAFIYEGAPNWASTDGVATVYVPGSAPVEVRLDGGGKLGMCAIALIENKGADMRIERSVAYFKSHPDMDRAYGWGMRWAAGSKD